MDTNGEIAANTAYYRAYRHDHRHPEEPSQVAELPQWVIDGRRKYARDHRRNQRQRKAGDYREPLVTLKPEDGIVDETAIDIAIKGQRPVSLTPIEASLMIVRMRQSGCSQRAIASRLHCVVSPGTRFAAAGIWAPYATMR